MGSLLSQTVESPLAARIAGCSLDLATFEAGCKRVEELACRYLLHGFQEVDVFGRRGETNSGRELASRLSIVPRYRSLFHVLLSVLERHDVLQINGDELVVLDLPDASLSACHALRDDVLREFPDRTVLARLVEAAAPQAVAVATGQTSAVEARFPAGSSALVEDVYAEDAVSRLFNDLATIAVDSAVHARLADRPGRISILEIGADTGGTSASVLKTLQPHADRVDYFYTDISGALLQEAEAKFAPAYPFVTFKPLDVELDPQLQGWRPGQFDVVLAANVLHATKNIGGTLANARRMLNQEGTLILNEVTRVFDFTTLTFGLMPGWWLFEDPEARLPSSPLLSSQHWERALTAAGFRDFSCFSPFASGQESQCLMVAGHGETAATHSQPAPQTAHTSGERAHADHPATARSSKARKIVHQQLDILQRQLELLRRK